MTNKRNELKLETVQKRSDARRARAEDQGVCVNTFSTPAPAKAGEACSATKQMSVFQRSKSPRELAVAILNRIDQCGAHAEPLLDDALAGADFPNAQDRGLLTELVYGTLRMRGRLDWIVARLYKGDAAALEAPVPNILRTGLYQLLFTDRIPPFAAVNEAVGMAKKLRPAAAGLVNAILRNALREKESMEWPEMDRDPGKAIAVRHSHPRWLVERWLDHFGIDETISICKANNTIPSIAVRVNTLKISRGKLIENLADEGFAAEVSRISPDGVRIAPPAAGLRDTVAFRNGLIRVQDEASQLVARLVAPQPGERILDLCAGAGGKTLHMAALMDNRGELTAVELHQNRLDHLLQDAERLGVTTVKTLQGDAGRLPEGLLAAFDRVLIDAPCSGLGTLRRNPEIRWRISPKDIEQSSRIQKSLLGGAADCVKSGGLLIYSVCTVTPEENEEVVADLLATRSEFKCIPPDDLPQELIDDAGFFRTFPHRHGTDGFFGAVFVRI